jgi:hypothetical protein
MNRLNAPAAPGNPIEEPKKKRIERALHEPAK